MNKLKINFENCYGIKKLDYEFDFNKCKTYAIYAPNGSMKTSFAKTFLDLSRKENSKDSIHENLETIRNIKDEMNNEIESESIFVINSYDEEFSSEKVSTLVANNPLRKDYEKIMLKIDSSKQSLILSLKNDVNTKKKDIESEIKNTFNKENFLEVIKELKVTLNSEIDYDFSKVDYDVIFNDKSIKFIEDSNFKNQLEEYIKLYDALLKKSRFLKNGLNHYNANKISTELDKNNFFNAKHELNLLNTQDDSRLNIKSSKELNEIIKEEKENILNNSELQKKFQSIDSKIKNTELRELREYLKEHRNYLTELVDLDSFRKKIWISLFMQKKDMLDFLSNNINETEKELKDILKEIEKDQELWKKVIEEFNSRFSVPFKIKIENQKELILGNNPIPHFKYEFYDEMGAKITSKHDLIDVLSRGERRALYLLNIIFEVKARQKDKIETLFIADDIADSFDYKNKYAIIEYLKEISEEPNFYQIILTHNFDFFRTIQGRLLSYKNIKKCLIVSKNETEIILENIEKKGLLKPFEHWKNKVKENNELYLIPLIPFVRNLIEYVSNDKNSDFKKLTSLLHIKQDTNSIKIKDLIEIYNNNLQLELKSNSFNENKLVIDLIFEVAKQISKKSNNIELEDKIILAISTRLYAEKFILSKIDNIKIKKNQTIKLIKMYKEKFPSETENIKLLKQVNLMTPENIHLNSFMYEPILDMGIDELQNLYTKISNLNQK